MTVVKNGMESIGWWNEKKCAVIHVKRGQVKQGGGDMKIADLKLIKSLDQYNTYKLLGVRSFEELAVQKRCHSIIRDAKRYADELDLQLWINFHSPVAVADGKDVEAKKVKQAI